MLQLIPSIENIYNNDVVLSIFFIIFITSYIKLLLYLICIISDRRFLLQEFAWDEKTKGKILSSFFWGYLVIQVPAGLMGQTISPKTLLIVTNTLCSLLTLIIPIGAHYGGWMMLCAIRVLQGLCQVSQYIYYLYFYVKNYYNVFQ